MTPDERAQADRVATIRAAGRHAKLIHDHAAIVVAEAAKIVRRLGELDAGLLKNLSALEACQSGPGTGHGAIERRNETVSIDGVVEQPAAVRRDDRPNANPDDASRPEQDLVDVLAGIAYLEKLYLVSRAQRNAADTLTRAARHASTLRSILPGYLGATLAVPARSDDELCRCCLTDTTTTGVPHVCEVDPRYAKTGLCGFCGRTVARFGKRPTMPILLIHHQGKNVPERLYRRELGAPLDEQPDRPEYTARLEREAAALTATIDADA